MSLRLSSAQSSHYVSLWGGLGIPGAEVPTEGDNGGSPLANDGITPDFEYRIETVTAPSAGTLAVYPDTSYEFSDAPDGSYSWVYRLFEDSIDRGTATEYLIVGAPTVSFDSATALPVFSGSAHISPVVAFDTATTPPVFSGTVHVSPASAFAVTTELPAFAGSLHVSPVTVFDTTTELPTFSGIVGTGTGFIIAATTGLPTFSGGVRVAPVASFDSSTAHPAFSGSAHVSPVAAFAATTALPIFVGAIGVQAAASIAFDAITALPVFSGSVSSFVPGQSASGVLFVLSHARPVNIALDVTDLSVYFSRETIMSSRYKEGEVARLHALITDEDGAPFDPASLTLSLRYGSGAVSELVFGIDPEISRVSQGRFVADIPLTQAGRLAYRWDASGAAVGAGESEFVVTASRFA